MVDGCPVDPVDGLPFTERVRRIADLGFEVEIWDWTIKDVQSLGETGARFSSLTGYVRATGLDGNGFPVVASEVVTPAMGLQAAGP